MLFFYYAIITHSSLIFEIFPLPSFISYLHAPIVLSCSLKISLILRYLSILSSSFFFIFWSFYTCFQYPQRALASASSVLLTQFFYTNKPDVTISSTDFDDPITVLVSSQFLMVFSSSPFISAHCLYTASCFHCSVFSW